MVLNGVVLILFLIFSQSPSFLLQNPSTKFHSNSSYFIIHHIKQKFITFKYLFVCYWILRVPTSHRPPNSAIPNFWEEKKSKLLWFLRKTHIESWEIGWILRIKVEKKKMDNGNNSGGGGSGGEKQSHRLPLSDVVSDCLRRWFQDTLKEAKAGDLSMQVLVAQMYFNGYGIPKDAQKVWFWHLKVKTLLWFFWVFCEFSIWVFIGNLDELGIWLLGLLEVKLRSDFDLQNWIWFEFSYGYMRLLVWVWNHFMEQEQMCVNLGTLLASCKLVLKMVSL